LPTEAGNNPVFVFTGAPDGFAKIEKTLYNNVMQLGKF